MQLFNLILLWLFFGLLCAFLAKQFGKNQLIWFAMGVLFSLFGVILLLGLSFFERLQRKRAASSPKQREPLPDKPKRYDFWYYLDATHQRQGPFEFSKLVDIWKKREIGEQSYLWSEGMKEWQSLRDLPDLHTDLKQS